MPSTLWNQTLLSSPSQQQTQSSAWFASAWKLQCLQQTGASLSHMSWGPFILAALHYSLKMLQGMSWSGKKTINNHRSVFMTHQMCLFVNLKSNRNYKKKNFLALRQSNLQFISCSGCMHNRSGFLGLFEKKCWASAGGSRLLGSREKELLCGRLMGVDGMEGVHWSEWRSTAASTTEMLSMPSYYETKGAEGEGTRTEGLNMLWAQLSSCGPSEEFTVNKHTTWTYLSMILTD